jgi:hypothetical protein
MITIMTTMTCDMLVNQKVKVYLFFNRIPAIRVFAVRVTPIFTNKIHALNTLKMATLLRSDVMLS